jgi:hypothetical protein
MHSIESHHNETLQEVGNKSRRNSWVQVVCTPPQQCRSLFIGGGPKQLGHSRNVA